MLHLNDPGSAMFLVSSTVMNGKVKEFLEDVQMNLAEFKAKYPSWAGWAEKAATAVKTDKKGNEVPNLGLQPLSFPDGEVNGKRVHRKIKRIA